MSVMKIGTIQTTRLRVYPRDPQDKGVIRNEVVVQPGTFDLFRDGNEFYWVMIGELNTNAVFHFDNKFIVAPYGDTGDGHPITVHSDRFSITAFKNLLLDPICQVGHPEHRLIFTIDPTVLEEIMSMK